MKNNGLTFLLIFWSLIGASQSITNILGTAWKRGERRIPFHRIVYANGRIWVDSAHRAERMRLYKKEEIVIDESGMVKNFKNIVFDF